MAIEFKPWEKKIRPGIYRRYVNIGEDDDIPRITFGLKAVTGPQGNITLSIYGGTLRAYENSGNVTLYMEGGELTEHNGNGNTIIEIGG